MDKQVVLVINKLNPSAAASLVKLEDEGLDIRVVVIRDVSVAPQDRSRIELGTLLVSELETDFFDEARLRADLEPLHGNVRGVVSRGEQSVQYLAKLSTACSSWGLPIPTAESLEIATDKERMRQRFMELYPEITPKYLKVQDDSEEVLAMIASEVGYPLIVKPANLASSLLIQKCDTQEQAQLAIKHALQAIRQLYKEHGRHEEPALIVEQMLEGGLYSFDAYVASDGDVSYCPVSKYETGQSIGVDDFFLYKRSLPGDLNPTEWDACRQVAEYGIEAIGLRSTAVNIELCNTNDGWKIIEIGPRIGRHRIEMYRTAYGIEHSDNDVKVRLGMHVETPTKLKRYCAVYSIYPSQEGTLKCIDNFDVINELASRTYVRRLANDGMYVRHAKNGGHALAEVILAHEDKTQFEHDSKWFESDVKPITEIQA